ncbi:MAG: stage V sporulation protein AA [Lachnospiraceae bacterium]|nr:stage V sporulation protein AA [Lachnospiraceae bacterium]
MGATDTLYLKIDKNVKVTDEKVSLGDIAQIFCENKPIENKVKTLRLPTVWVHGPGRYVYSILDVFPVILQEYPKLEISNLGETDFILTLEATPSGFQAWSRIKTALLCFLSFFGAAISIMAFNTDVGLTDLFGRLYEMFTGRPSNGFTLLEISYSIGVGLGILIFFHHFARKKSKPDPTPLQVQMRVYEEDVDKTLIENEGRNPQKTTPADD